MKVTIEQVIDYLQQYPPTTIVVLDEDDPSVDANDSFINLSWMLEQIESVEQNDVGS